MRDRTGQRITLPVTTQPGLLLEVWMVFQRAAARSEAMPAVLTPSAGIRDAANNLAA